MTEKMWNELTPGQQACLFDIVTSNKTVDGWIWTGDIPHFVRSALDSLIAHGLIEERITSPHRICYVKITPTGFIVWQQGQTPAEPDELARLREQVAALTVERDTLAARLASIEIHHAAAWEAGYYAGVAAGKQTNG